MEKPSLAPDVRAALPTFLIIGAPKCGTTSLHRYLAAHPSIAMSSEKEPMCFEASNWIERLGDYRELFNRQAPVRGEASSAYSSFPWVPEIPDRVRATVPDMRVIYVVREPIARIVSHYAQNAWDGLALRPFSELMDDLEHPENIPVWCSRYATQLGRWLERFPEENVLVLEDRDLLLEREQTLRRIFGFLGVDPDFTSVTWDAEHNTAGEHRVPRPAADRLARHRLGQLALRLPPIRRALTRPLPKPTMTREQHERLAALLAPEVQRFRSMTGLSLDQWSL